MRPAALLVQERINHAPDPRQHLGRLPGEAHRDPADLGREALCADLLDGVLREERGQGDAQPRGDTREGAYRRGDPPSLDARQGLDGHPTLIREGFEREPLTGAKRSQARGDVILKVRRHAHPYGSGRAGVRAYEQIHDLTYK